MERLQKIIANSGYCSRRRAEEYIKMGLVKVDGKIITELGFKCLENQDITIDGNRLKKDDKVYILLNKPPKTICTLKDNFNRDKIVDLILIKERIYPIGRLDYDTTGAIILTNDGDLANLLMHPRNQIGKTYLVEVNKKISDQELKILESGVEIENGFKTSKSKTQRISSNKFYLTIHEGKNHQVKRMLLSINFLVTKLHRSRIDKISVDDLKIGQYRHLSASEVNYLKNKGK